MDNKCFGSLCSLKESCSRYVNRTTINGKWYIDPPLKIGAKGVHTCNKYIKCKS